MSIYEDEFVRYTQMKNGSQREKMFRSSCQGKILLHDYDVLCCGKNSLGVDIIKEIRFVYCEKTPLKGQHMIHINGVDILFKSMSAFRKEFFQGGSLFEKCSYLITKHGLIRLSLILESLYLSSKEGVQKQFVARHRCKSLKTAFRRCEQEVYKSLRKYMSHVDSMPDEFIQDEYTQMLYNYLKTQIERDWFDLCF